jgi:hypothetical protein
VVVHPLGSELVPRVALAEVLLAHDPKLVQQIQSLSIRFSGLLGTAVQPLSSTKSGGCQTREQLDAN